MSPILVVAEKEWLDGWRNRWLLTITIVFALMAIGLAWFGAVASGQTGPSPLPATIASLSSLAVLLIPLIALLLGYDSFVGEQEQGTLALLVSYPVSRMQLVIGKFLGQAGILTIATAGGFGSAAIALAFFSTEVNIAWPFLRFIGSAILLSWVFLAFAYLISLLVTEKSTAAGLTLAVWFFSTLVYDLGLLAILVGSEGHVSEFGLTAALLANPTDAFRLINLSGLDAQSTGMMATISQMNIHILVLFGAMAAWLLLALSLASFRFQRKPL